jgi:putative ABC transport system permease protein
MGEVLRYFSVLSILVAGLGLFGMAAFAAQQRTKEIGIRRTLGAPVFNIYFLLSSSFLKWVLLANVVAWPAAYFISKHWLRNFAFRTAIGISPFLAAMLAVLLIAVFTVSFQSLKASHTRPVEALRYE